MRKSTRGSIDASVLGVSLQRASTHDGSKTLPNSKASSLPTSPISQPQENGNITFPSTSSTTSTTTTTTTKDNTYQRVLPSIATLKTANALPQIPHPSHLHSHNHSQSLPTNDITDNNNNTTKDNTYQRVVLPRTDSNTKPKENDSIYQRVLPIPPTTRGDETNFLPVPATKPIGISPNSNRARSPTATNSTNTNGKITEIITLTPATIVNNNVVKETKESTPSNSNNTTIPVPMKMLVVPPPSGSALTRSSSTGTVDTYQAILPERFNIPNPNNNNNNSSTNNSTNLKPPFLSHSANSDYANSSLSSTNTSSTTNPSSTESLPLPSPTESPSNRPRAVAKKRPEPPANVKMRMVNTMSRAQADRLKNAEKQSERQLDPHLASLSLELKVPQFPPRNNSNLNGTNSPSSSDHAQTSQSMNNVPSNSPSQNRDAHSPKEPRTLSPMSVQQVQVEKRRLISEEILSTEGTYVDTLDKVIKVR